MAKKQIVRSKDAGGHSDLKKEGMTISKMIKALRIYKKQNGRNILVHVANDPEQNEIRTIDCVALQQLEDGTEVIVVCPTDTIIQS